MLSLSRRFGRVPGVNLGADRKFCCESSKYANRLAVNAGKVPIVPQASNVK